MTIMMRVQRTSLFGRKWTRRWWKISVNLVSTMPSLSEVNAYLIRSKSVCTKWPLDLLRSCLYLEYWLLFDVLPIMWTAYRGIINLINGFTSWWDQDFKFILLSLQGLLEINFLERIFMDSLEDYANHEIAEIDARNPNDSSISLFSWFTILLTQPHYTALHCPEIWNPR